jgi:hypothetical protein
MPIGQPTWRARDQPLRDPTSRWSMPGDDRGGRHGRCPPSPHPARRSPRDRPGRRSDPSAAGRGRGQRPAAGPGRRALGPGGGRAGPGRPGLGLTMRERWQGRPGSPYARAAGGWLARTGSLPSGLPVEVNDGDRLLAAALGLLDAGDPGRAGVLEQLRGDHPAAPALPRPKGGRRWPSGRRRPTRRSGSPMGPGCWLAPGPTSAAAGCGPTSPPGRSRRWSPPGWSPLTPWPRPPSTAGGCWASPAPASSPRGPADILLGHGDPLTDPGSRWRG